MGNQHNIASFALANFVKTKSIEFHFNMQRVNNCKPLLKAIEAFTENLPKLNFVALCYALFGREKEREREREAFIKHCLFPILHLIKLK
jgi:hypothetical protein